MNFAITENDGLIFQSKDECLEHLKMGDVLMLKIGKRRNYERELMINLVRLIVYLVVIIGLTYVTFMYLFEPMLPFSIRCVLFLNLLIPNISGHMSIIYFVGITR